MESVRKVSARACGRHPLLTCAASAELPHVELGDALSVGVAIRQSEPERFERAVLRRLARSCVDRPGARGKRTANSARLRLGDAHGD
jgi:hypothetical protein